MKKSRIVIVSLLFAGVSINTVKAEPEYNTDSKFLTIPTVKIGDIHVYDATLKLNGAGAFFDIVGCSGKLQLVTQGINGDRSLFTWNSENRFPEISLQLENNRVVARSYTPK